jgi:hypothetical protein
LVILAPVFDGLFRSHWLRSGFGLLSNPAPPTSGIAQHGRL